MRQPRYVRQPHYVRQLNVCKASLNVRQPKSHYVKQPLCTRHLRKSVLCYEAISFTKLVMRVNFNYVSYPHYQTQTHYVQPYS